MTRVLFCLIWICAVRCGCYFEVGNFLLVGVEVGLELLVLRIHEAVLFLERHESLHHFSAVLHLDGLF